LAHNVYIRIHLSTESDEFPFHEHGIPEQIKKQVRVVVSKDKNWKLRRAEFDIVDEKVEFIDEFEDFEID
jgi:hypothetical protein